MDLRSCSHWALSDSVCDAKTDGNEIFAKDLAKEWVEYPFLAMPANAIANGQCERTLKRAETYL